MTPERKAWWDSLPVEEKRVRSFIAAEKSTTKVAKATINSKGFCDVDYEKNAISMSKQLLKLLRKQIAQRPVMRTQPPTASPYKCPCCGASLMYLLRCVECGQKLRWK